MTATSRGISRYLGRIVKMADEYNRSPLTLSDFAAVVGAFGMVNKIDRNKLLCYWHFKTHGWDFKNVERVLGYIHDMWTLQLVSSFVYEGDNRGGTLVLQLRQERPSVDAERVQRLLPISYEATPYDYKVDAWYAGDRLLLSSDQNKQRSVFFSAASGRLGMNEELRRVSQLVEYDKLTSPSKDQDRLFVEKYERVFQRLAGRK